MADVGLDRSQGATNPPIMDSFGQPKGQVPPSVEAKFPLFEIIDTYTARLPALQEVMPSRTARACLLPDGRLIKKYSSSLEQSTYGHEQLLKGLDDLGRMDHAVLIIEDIDATWLHTLGTRYPESLDVKFLAQHVLRLGGLEATYDTHNYLGDGYRALVKRVDAQIPRKLPGNTVRDDYRGHHIDVHIYRSSLQKIDIMRSDVESTRAHDGYRTEELMV